MTLQLTLILLNNKDYTLFNGHKQVKSRSKLKFDKLKWKKNCLKTFEDVYYANAQRII